MRGIVLAGWVMVALVGCGGSQRSDARADTRRNLDGRPSGDGARGSVLQLVVNKILLPTRTEDYAADLDGNGTKDNQLGVIQSTMQVLPLGTYAFQNNLDMMLGDGSFILLLDLLGRSLTDDAAARIQGLLGADLDNPPDPTDNFSGAETLAVSTNAVPDLFLDGTITAGKLKVGPGTLVGPLPTPSGSAPQIVTFQRAQLEADVSPTGLTNGIIRGAIPWTEVDQKFIPMIAIEVSATLQSTTTPQNVKDALSIAFDTDKNGVVSAAEIRQSQLLKLVLRADVDLDGDKTPDALSIGLAFTAVTCKIKR